VFAPSIRIPKQVVRTHDFVESSGGFFFGGSIRKLVWVEFKDKLPPCRSNVRCVCSFENTKSGVGVGWKAIIIFHGENEKAGVEGDGKTEMSNA